MVIRPWFYAYGTEGNDSLNLASVAGTVSLNGLAGNDFLAMSQFGGYADGGTGKDVVVGGAGDDYIDGGAGDDNIKAGAGDDNVYAGDDNDVVTCGLGNDYAVGGAGDDLMFGQAGNDNLIGGFGNDTIIGGVGDDFIAGGYGVDRISAGLGNDRVYAGAGDMVGLGGGQDVVTFTEDTSSERVRVVINGFGQDDTLVVSTEFAVHSVQFIGGKIVAESRWGDGSLTIGGDITKAFDGADGMVDGHIDFGLVQQHGNLKFDNMTFDGGKG